MRESVGSTYIFSLAITFTLIFSGFLVLAINYNRAYKIKNEVTSMVERYEGITGKSKLDKSGINTQGSIKIINDYLNNNNYHARGRCQQYEGYDVYGVNDLDADYETDASINNLKITDFTQQYNYCLTFIPDTTECVGFFRVTVFFDFNLPIVGNLTKFSITGQTNEMYPVYIGTTQVIGKSRCK